jgi:hypothetical protein
VEWSGEQGSAGREGQDEDPTHSLCCLFLFTHVGHTISCTALYFMTRPLSHRYLHSFHSIILLHHLIASSTLYSQDAPGQHRQACVGTLLSLVRSLYGRNAEAKTDNCVTAVKLYCSNLIKVSG